MYSEILKKDKYKKWEEFSANHPYSSIHQTPRWGRFQVTAPSRDKFWIIAVYERKKGKQHLVAGTVLVKHKLPKGEICWLYSPRGPLLTYDKPKEARHQMRMLLKKIKQIARKEKAIFYRIDPALTKGDHRHHKKQLHFRGFKTSHNGFQPETTLMLDISHPEEEILKQMHKKGRYNIRLAEKKGVEIVEVQTPTLTNSVNSAQTFSTRIQNYYEILQETLKRDKFYGHSLSFYKSMCEKLAEKSLHKGFARMYLAKYTKESGKEEFIAGTIVTFYKDTAIYYYGASSNEHRNVMGPYLLQWHAMQEAKRFGCTKYDFLGISPPTRRAPAGSPSHPWHGVSEFKHKFGGKIIHYMPPQEYPFKYFLYYLYKITKFTRSILRKFRG